MAHDTSLDGQTYKDGTYTGTGRGYNGILTVQVTIQGGKIAKAALVRNEGDDLPYLNRAKAVLSAIVSTQSTKVDVVSGATYSSVGLISAVENALKKAIIKKSNDEEESASSNKKPNKKPAAPAVPTVPEQEDEPYTGEGFYVDGVYTGFARGYKGFMYVSVTIKNERISAIDITKTGDDEPYLTNAKTLIKRILAKQTTEGIDAVSGATYSSNGLLDAVKKALAKAIKPVEETEPTHQPEQNPSDEPSTEPPKEEETDAAEESPSDKDDESADKPTSDDEGSQQEEPTTESGQDGEDK